MQTTHVMITSPARTLFPGAAPRRLGAEWSPLPIGNGRRASVDTADRLVKGATEQYAAACCEQGLRPLPGFERALAPPHAYPTSYLGAHGGRSCRRWDGSSRLWPPFCSVPTHPYCLTYPYERSPCCPAPSPWPQPVPAHPLGGSHCAAVHHRTLQSPLDRQGHLCDVQLPAAQPYDRGPGPGG